MNHSNKLLQFYLSLIPEHKIILQIFALFNSVLSVSELLLVIKKYNINKSNELMVTSQELRNICRFLGEEKLITNEDGCNICIMHQVLKDAVAQPWAEQVFSFMNRQIFHYESYLKETIRINRLLIYFNKAKDFEVFLAEIYRRLYCGYIENCKNNTYFQALNNILINIPFDGKWLADLDSFFQKTIIAFHIKNYFPLIKSYKEPIEFIENNIKKFPDINEVLAEYYLFSGDLQKSVFYTKKITVPWIQAVFDADINFLLNQKDTAINKYQEAIKLLKKATGKSKVFFGDYHALFYMLVCLSSGDRSLISQAVEKAQIFAETFFCNMFYSYSFAYIKQLIDYFQGNYRVKKAPTDNSLINDKLSLAISAMFKYWLFPESVKRDLAKIKNFFNAAEKSDCKLMACMFAEVIAKFTSKETKYVQYLEQQNIKLRFLDLIKIKPTWEIALDQLLDEDSAYKNARKRMVWYLDTNGSLFSKLRHFLYPVEQTEKTNGSWSKGKRINIEKLCRNKNKFDYITEHDDKILQILENLIEAYYFDESSICHKVLPALIDHPHIYDMSDTEQKIELTEGKVELLVMHNKKADNFSVKLSMFSDEAKFKLRKITPQYYEVIKYDNSLVKLAKILTKNGVIVPKQAKDKLLKAVTKIADNLIVHSSIENEMLPSKPASSRLEVRLMPYKEGLQVQIIARPFDNDSGPICYPGKGSKIIMMTHQQQKMQLVRNLTEEQHNFKKLLEASSILKKYFNDFNCVIEDIKACLSLLTELKSLENEIHLSWPKGEGFGGKKKLAFANFKFKIVSDNDWFDLQGDVIVDGQKVMQLKELLDLLDNSDNHFVPLASDKVIALTEHFRKQLNKLKTAAYHDKNGYRFHKLSTFAVDNILQSFSDVDLDTKWLEQINKLRNVEKLNPQLPSTMQGKLWPYQLEGYKWLYRLANWGFGACIADDMGLGKTIQAITIILQQAKKGPSLVIAPTSVCHNWQQEINKFAPTLKPYLFGESKRENLIDSVGKNDVIICSYGLLQTSSELLNERTWQVAVIDEAQAIKNTAAKRTKVTHKLRAEFKLALTGTPIENHLGELWSLFHFINPGFLGSEESFRKKFMLPIEQQQNQEVRELLKNLIKPFLLRRLKSEVLKDLPPKIEQTISIELSSEEKAFYEALRSRAAERINGYQEVMKPGQKCIKILAEITRLRQACCHSTMVHEKINIESSKLKQFTYLLEDILENQHKVLVFSQFVRYLKIVEKLLHKKEISYQYLDGQTPVAQRKKNIHAFQSGKAQVFLLSLKAGGVGLNLTAADYVILLDPWWNPAVENQAADRAHRIGQTRPVTIYRLISEQTIEEKIMQLHQRKKDLAEALLKDTGSSSKLSEKELLQLIKQD